jgi:hypothetical protein
MPFKMKDLVVKVESFKGPRSILVCGGATCEQLSVCAAESGPEGPPGCTDNSNCQNESNCQRTAPCGETCNQTNQTNACQGQSGCPGPTGCQATPCNESECNQTNHLKNRLESADLNELREALQQALAQLKGTDSRIGAGI